MTTNNKKKLIIFTLTLVLMFSIIPFLTNETKKTYSTTVKICEDPDNPYLTDGHCCPSEEWSYRTILGKSACFQVALDEEMAKKVYAIEGNTCKLNGTTEYFFSCFVDAVSATEVELGICESIDDKKENTACHKGGGTCNSDNCECGNGKEWSDSEQKCVAVTSDPSKEQGFCSKCISTSTKEVLKQFFDNHGSANGHDCMHEGKKVGTWESPSATKDECPEFDNLASSSKPPSTSPLNCKPGTYANGNECKECPKDYYCEGGLEPEKYCGDGKVSQPGSQSISDCQNKPETTCPAGKYLNNGSCESCPKDYYCEGGTSDKVKCPQNFKSEEGSTSESACKCGTGYRLNNGICILDCAPGTYANGSTCTQCPLDHYCPGNRTELDGRKYTCPESSNSVAGSDSITDCKCPAGTYLGTSNTCNSCPEGYTSQPGSQTATDCNIPITKCAANQYYDGISKKCESCPTNSTSVSGSNSITSCKCPSGYRLNTENKSCELDCAAGTYINNNTCAECPANHYCPGNRVGQEGKTYECPQNSTSQSGSQSIDDCTCNSGYTWNSTTSKCVYNNTDNNNNNNNNNYDNNNTTNNNTNNNNNSSNPQTGSSILIVWVVGIVGILYACWYFKNLNNNA